MLLLHLEKQDFRTKLKADIKDYLELRNSIRRMKNTSETRMNRIISENKLNVDKKNPES